MDFGKLTYISQKIVAGLLIGGLVNISLQVHGGFLGEYFTGTPANPFPNAELKLIREENQVFYNWGTGSPGPNVPVNNFTARFRGILTSDESGIHTFRTRSDDGVRLYINGNLIINNWTNHAPTINTGTFNLSAGISYDIRLEYYEAGGGAVIELDWAKPSTGGVFESLDSVYVETPIYTPPVVNPQLWFRADRGTNCSIAGCTINSWNDQSGQNNTASRPAGSNDTITYSENLYNFNPGVIFDIGPTQSRRGLQGTFGTTMTGTGASVFFVGNLKNNGSTWPRILSLTSNATTPDWTSTQFFNVARLNGTTTLMSYQANTTRGNILNGIGQDMIASFHYGSGPASRAYRDGVLQSTTTHTLGNLNVNNFWIGANSEYVHYTQMDIAEMLVFNQNINDIKRQSIESYLALKYGFTLANGTRDYMASDEITNYWRTDIAGAFTSNIFGIGRDDAMNLSQVQSRSRNPESVITLQALDEGTNIAPTFTDIADREFLTLADNNGTATWNTAGAPANTNILTRRWRTQEVGDTGDASLSFDVNNPNFNIPEPVSFGRYYLVRDTDGDGLLSDESLEELTNIGGGIHEISGINLSHNQVFTLATLTVDTINPTINSASISSGSLLPKRNHTLSFNYFDNESGINTGEIIDFSNNIAPSATITTTPATIWGVPPHPNSLVNGVIRTDGAFDYEYHSDTTNAFLDFNLPSTQQIGNIRIHNRTGCCSERLTGAQLQFFDANNTLLYTYTLPNTSGLGIVNINLVTLGQVQNAKRIRLSTTGNYINIREFEIFPIQSNLQISKFNAQTGSYGPNIASQVAMQSGSLTVNNASYNLNIGIYGKYRYSFTIRDIAGNIQTRVGYFYIDEPELIISQSEIDIGTLRVSENSYSENITLTVRTVGAPFTLLIEESQAFLSGLESLSLWNGSTGYGYELTPFSGNILTPSSSLEVVSQNRNINTQGEKNTYTYTLRFGGRINQEQAAGVYEGRLNFGINLEY